MAEPVHVSMGSYEAVPVVMNPCRWRGGCACDLAALHTGEAIPASYWFVVVWSLLVVLCPMTILKGLLFTTTMFSVL